MIINTINISGCQPQTIVIGRRGTYDTMQIAFDLSYLVESYGNGVAVLAVKRSQDSSAYPAVTSQEDDLLLWTVSETDTYYVGAGECQLMWYVDGGLAKTIIYPMVVMRDILATSEEAPDAYQEWVDALIAEGAETLQNAQNAAQSASDAEGAKDDAVTAKEAAEAAQQAAETAVTHYPKIENNYWMVWDSATQQYVSTGIQAEGEDGYSPEVTIETITGGHRVTITDKDHPQGQSFDVMDGQGGGGTSDYTDLTNKPSINNVTLTDNKTAADLGLATPSDIPTTAGDIEFDDTQTYPSETVGAELSQQKNAIDAKAPLIINTASGDVASFADGADGGKIKQIVGTIVPVQSGTGDPSPYNVRPISGWTGANITGTATNLCGGESLADGLLATYPGAIKNEDDKTVRFGYAGSANPDGLGVKFKENTQYTFVFAISNTSVSRSNMAIMYTDGTQSFVPDNGVGINTKTVIVAVSTANKTVRGLYRKQSGGTTYIYYDESGVFEGVHTAADFVPYVGQTLPINWQSSAGTIYGGAVTLNEDGSADVVATMAKSKISDFVYTINAGRFLSSGAVPGALKPSSNFSVANGLKCDTYKTGTSSSTESSTGNSTIAIAASGLLSIRDERYSTAAEFKTAMGDVEFVFTLATPSEPIHFDNIGSLLTYYGQNNVWIDTGSISECDYPADTKLYIDGLTAPDEDMIADSNIANGKYFVVNNQLYLSTAAIAAGASIVPGTNCTATNLAEALNALNT